MALNDLVWEPDEGWRDQAACAGSDLELFFPVGEDAESVAPAKAICAICPVREDCLNYAISTNQPEGVWGGMTGPERRRLRRRLRERQRRAS
ncbi:MAG: WhiB family transcriptional regulator [Actinomycetota bacterium]|nr:WhiB family transcriptional regulator [Actinomycetota bacterium]